MKKLLYIFSILIITLSLLASCALPTPPEETDYTYNDFSPSEKKMFEDTFGFVLPFIPTNEYYVEEYTGENETGLNYYTLGNTKAEYDAYFDYLSEWERVGPYFDAAENVRYRYEKDGVHIDLGYYISESSDLEEIYRIDIIIYKTVEVDPIVPPSPTEDDLKVAAELEALTAPTSASSTDTVRLAMMGLTHVDVSVTWAVSDNGYAEIVDGKLVISSLPETDTVITLTATLTCNQATATKTFSFMLYAPTVSDADKVAAELEALTAPTSAAATGALNLTAAGATYTDVSIAWAVSNNAYAEISGGKLVISSLPEADTVITLTATLTCNQATATKTFSFTIAKADSSLNTIAQALAAQVGTKMKVSGTVVATNSRSFLVKDATGAILVYLNAAPSVSVGDVVTVEGNIAEYKGNQFDKNATVTKIGTATVDHGTPKLVDGAGIDAYITGGVSSIEYVKMVGTLDFDGTYYNLTVDGATKGMGSLTYPVSSTSSYDGKKIEVYGYVLYISNGSTCVSIIYTDIKVVSDTGTGTGSGSGSGTGSGTGHTYTDFTSTEKALFNQYFGFVIPFMPTNEYELEEYTYEDETGLHFYTFDNTEAEFESYLAMFSSWTELDPYYDEYGDIWYCYQKGSVYIDLGFYLIEDTAGNYYCADIYVYTLSSSQGGSTDEDVLTNSGAGLPADADGVYDVDFTDATYVDDVTDQGYYLDGCPTTGSPAVLVIPVEFSDRTALSLGYTLDKIVNAFCAQGETDYYSVYDYYYEASYGKLTLDVTVLEEWFRPQYASSYYKTATMDYDGNEIKIGDQLVLNEALKYLAGIMDLSEFDSDGNGKIDSVVLITTLEIDSDVMFNWAYRYWNLYTDDDGYYYEYDEVSANDYLWAPYQFLYEGADADGNAIYNDTSAMNTYTFIHEFGHVLGADDYYDTAYVGEPLQGCDIMDSMTGDHNPYSKFNYGWITTSRLIVTDSSVTVNLKSFVESGDTVIIANNWDNTLGAYQEYYVLMYYKNDGLNGGDYGYFMNEGIVVYHVNSTLYKEVKDGETYYDVYNNNTDSSDEYGSVDNLIELVSTPDGDIVFTLGDSLGTQTDDLGNTLGYTFTVDAITAEEATITFTKK